MELIKGETCPSVWLKAVEHLTGCPAHEDFDVFLGIATPTIYSASDRVILDTVDAFLRDHGGSRVETVAETLFPLSDYLHHGAKGVYEVYPKRIQHIRSARSNDRRWGTYALRLLEPRLDPKKRKYVPLAALVTKIRDHGKYRAAHELNIGPFEDDIEIYDPDRDRLRFYGGPCLSHLSFKVYDGRVRLNATYRSHFYVQRLLGNLIGLARLQFFVANESGLEVGPLTINSTFARLDTGGGNGDGGRWGEGDITRLIAACRKAADAEATSPVQAVVAPAAGHTPLPSAA
jgi:hypothetical protein